MMRQAAHTPPCTAATAGNQEGRVFRLQKRGDKQKRNGPPERPLPQPEVGGRPTLRGWHALPQQQSNRSAPDKLLGALPQVFHPRLRMRPAKRLQLLRSHLLQLQLQVRSRCRPSVARRRRRLHVRRRRRRPRGRPCGCSLVGWRRRRLFRKALLRPRHCCVLLRMVVQRTWRRGQLGKCRLRARCRSPGVGHKTVHLIGAAQDGTAGCGARGGGRGGEKVSRIQQ